MDFTKQQTLAAINFGLGLIKDLNHLTAALGKDPVRVAQALNKGESVTPEEVVDLAHISVYLTYLWINRAVRLPDAPPDAIVKFEQILKMSNATVPSIAILPFWKAMKDK